MSCMMMLPAPLAALANATETLLNSGYDYFGFDAPNSLFDAARDCRNMTFYSATELYRKLYTLNVTAYNGRYSSHEPLDTEPPEVDLSRYKVHRPPEFEGHHHAVRPWHYHLAQLLDFWIYQVSEDATRNDEFFHAMRKFRDCLFRFIVRNSAEYSSHRWGEL